MRQAVSRLENEKRNLQEEFGRNESRATKLELQRLSLEGDLQRLQMILQEKDSHIQVCDPAEDLMSTWGIRIPNKFKHWRAAVEKWNNIHNEIKSILKTGNACYCIGQNILYCCLHVKSWRLKHIKA
jgi:hypothetical protein